jgi:sec-independent protein translocase protein TatA
MEALSPFHLLIILAVILLFFGGRRIPEMMRGLGEGVRSFKEGMREPSSSTQASAQTPPVDTAPPAAEKK